MINAVKRKVCWDEYEQLVDGLTEQVSCRMYDLIIGIARGGLPVAVSISHGIGCRNMGVIFARKTVADHILQFDHRTELVVSDYVLPREKPKSVLIVDDIVAYGDLFTSVITQIEEHYGGVDSIALATLFADVQQIQASPYHDILGRLHHAEAIDNQAVWIVFPWEN